MENLQLSPSLSPTFSAPASMLGLVGFARTSTHHMHSGPVHVHQDVSEIGRANVAWARCFGLVSNTADTAQAAAIRCGSFAAHTYSQASREVVRLGADLILWLYLFDDRVGEGHDIASVEALRSRFAAYEQIIKDRRLPADPSPLHTALLDIVERAVRLGATSVWIDRFRKSMAAYFEGCALELPHRQMGTPPPVAEYTYIRSQSVGAYPVLDLIELNSDGFLTDSDFVQLKLIRYTASLLCAWVNDVYSFPKEMNDGEPLNIVAAIAHERSLDSEQALLEAIELHNTDYEQFLEMVDEARRGMPSTYVQSYLAGIVDWVHGNRKWTQLCGRYVGA